MSLIGKLLDITSVGGTMAGVVLLQKLAARLVIVVALTIITSLMIAMLMAAGFYIIYTSLVFYGLVPQAALLVTCGLGLVTTFVLIVLTAFYVRQIRNLHRHLLPAKPLAEIQKLAEVFIEGFLSRK